MEQRFDIGLNAKINDFADKFGITRIHDNSNMNNDTDVFEEFGNYIITSSMLEENFTDLHKVSTNKAQGIDGIVILVNNRLISEITDCDKIGQYEKINLKFGFIQSTTQRSFDQQKFSSFTDNVVNFFKGSFRIEPFSTIMKRLLDEDGEYINRMDDTPQIQLYYLSARTEFDVTSIIENEKSKINNREELKNLCRLTKFCVFQKNEIKTEYEHISKFHTVEMKFDANVQLESNENGIEMSLLTSIKFSELKKLILTSDQNLKSNLFIENVRSYIGNTPVNVDIENTLKDKNKRLFFPYLNNGLTILCDHINRHPIKDKFFVLTFPRIINGCQTTTSLFKMFKDSENANEIDDVEVIAKVISTQNEDLKKSIIYATNNQNAIDKDLQSLNDFHTKIETYFLGNDSMPVKLYYERLRGQYSSITPPYTIINIEAIARVYISVFLKEPEKMKSNALTKIDEYQKSKKIFNDDSNLECYYYCAILHYWFNKFIVNRVISLKSKTMDMHLLMACDLFLNKHSQVIKDKIQYLSNEDNAKNIFETTCFFLNSDDCGFLFERRGFYSTPKTKQLIDKINANTTTEV